MNAAASFLLLLSVTRTVGVSDGGVFSLAFSTAQMMLTVGKFGVRAFHATDIKYRISFSSYSGARIIYIVLMVAAEAAFILLMGYSLNKAAIFLAVFWIKAIEAVEDLFQGELQRRGNLDIAGKLFSLRNLITIVVWMAAMSIIQDLLVVSILTSVLTVVLAFILNCSVSGNYYILGISLDYTDVKLVTVECFPLFLSTFMSLYIYNIPKFFIDRFGSNDEVAIYSILFMPTFFINLFSDFIFKPLLTVVAEKWDRGDALFIYRILKRQFLIITAFTVCASVMAYVFGVFLVSTFFHVDISGYVTEMVVLMISGGCSAGAYLLLNVLTAMRKQIVVLKGYVFASVLITILSILFISRNRVLGSAVSYFSTQLLLGLFLLLNTIINIRNKGAI